MMCKLLYRLISGLQKNSQRLLGVSLRASGSQAGFFSRLLAGFFDGGWFRAHLSGFRDWRRWWVAWEPLPRRPGGDAAALSDLGPQGGRASLARFGLVDRRTQIACSMLRCRRSEAARRKYHWRGTKIGR